MTLTSQGPEGKNMIKLVDFYDETQVPGLETVFHTVSSHGMEARATIVAWAKFDIRYTAGGGGG
jgi:hypothetical protein